MSGGTKTKYIEVYAALPQEILVLYSRIQNVSKTLARASESQAESDIEEANVEIEEVSAKCYSILHSIMAPGDLPEKTT